VDLRGVLKRTARVIITAQTMQTLHVEAGDELERACDRYAVDA
jgi:hypothetical protein